VSGKIQKKISLSTSAVIAVQGFKKEAEIMTESEIIDYCIRATFGDRNARITLEEVRKLHFADLEID